VFTDENPSPSLPSTYFPPLPEDAHRLHQSPPGLPRSTFPRNSPFPTCPSKRRGAARSPTAGIPLHSPIPRPSSALTPHPSSSFAHRDPIHPSPFPSIPSPPPRATHPSCYSPKSGSAPDPPLPATAPTTQSSRRLAVARIRKVSHSSLPADLRSEGADAPKKQGGADCSARPVQVRTLHPPLLRSGPPAAGGRHRSHGRRWRRRRLQGPDPMRVCKRMRRGLAGGGTSSLLEPAPQRACAGGTLAVLGRGRFSLRRRAAGDSRGSAAATMVWRVVVGLLNP
jgi:hypothetical protein